MVSRDLCLTGGRGCGQSAWVCLHSAIYEIFQCNGVALDLWPIRGGGGVSLPWVYVHSSICETYLV